VTGTENGSVRSSPFRTSVQVFNNSPTSGVARLDIYRHELLRLLIQWKADKHKT